MPKKITFSVSLALLCVLSTPASAQLRFHDSSLRSALVEYLYQYGKEIFNRGVDPQEASFVLQRALVLDCNHPGAKAALSKMSHKYPEVSIRIWGCDQAQPEIASQEFKDEAVFSEPVEKTLSQEQENAEASLRDEYQATEEQVTAMIHELDDKNKTITDYKKQLRTKQEEGGEPQDASFSNIAQDQKDLIRIQQSNIDYLKTELADLKKNGTQEAAQDNQYLKNQIDVAASGLDAQEQRMTVEAKEAEAQDLRQKLNELQEQLALVQKLVDEKNITIESLEKELKLTDQAKR